MDLLEHEGKQLFADYGLTVPQSILVSSPKEAKQAFEDVDVVLKSQIPSGHRGKAGGVVMATKDDVVEKAEKLFSHELLGYEVKSLLVEEKIEIDQEWYLALIVDRLARRIMLLFSTKGGINVEDISQSPDLLRLPWPLTSRDQERLGQAIIKSGAPGSVASELAKISSTLDNLMSEQDAVLVEVNPLAVSGDELILLDSKITIDDNALFRHPDWDKEKMTDEFVYVQLEGDIAVIGNGAGLVMATLDMLELEGGKPANFLDIGGGAPAERMEKAVAKVLSQENVKGLLVNIFGGITRTDEVAAGLLAYKKKKSIEIPIVVRLTGVEDKKARAELDSAGITAESKMSEAVRQIVEEIS